MKNKRRLIIAFVLLVGAITVYLFLQNHILNIASQKYRIKDTSLQSGTIIEAQTASLNGNGRVDTVQLQLLSKYNGSNNAKLVLIEDGKEIFTKDVALEFNFGKLELVNLFGDINQQILLTTGVGGHSLLGYFYQLVDNKLVPLCPEDGQGADQNINKKADCAFFSDGTTIYSRDLDSDGIAEIIEGGREYLDSENPIKIYKWDGAVYRKVVGATYDKMLVTLE